MPAVPAGRRGFARVAVYRTGGPRASPCEGGARDVVRHVVGPRLFLVDRRAGRPPRRRRRPAGRPGPLRDTVQATSTIPRRQASGTRVLRPPPSRLGRRILTGDVPDPRLGPGSRVEGLPTMRGGLEGFAAMGGTVRRRRVRSRGRAAPGADAQTRLLCFTRRDASKRQPATPVPGWCSVGDPSTPELRWHAHGRRFVLPVAWPPVRVPWSSGPTPLWEAGLPAPLFGPDAVTAFV